MSISDSLVDHGWRRTTLGTVCHRITDGTHQTPTYMEKGIPFVSAANIAPFRPLQFDSYVRYITREEHEELIQRCHPQEGDLLVSKIGTLGLTKLIDTPLEFSIFVGLALLKTDKSQVYGEFLEQLLNSPQMRQAMVQASPGTTRPTLTIEQIEQLEVDLPPIPEQRRIADILDAADGAIRRSERVIDKLRDVKKGLLHDLLTRGLDAEGNLRDPEAHPEQFSESPPHLAQYFCRYPSGWRLGRIGEFATLQGGYAFSSSSFVRFGDPIIRMSNLKDGYLDVTDAAHIPDSVAMSSRQYLLQEGDLLVGMSGSLRNYAVIEDSDLPAYLNQRVGRFILEDDHHLTYEYLTYVVISRIYMRQVEIAAAGAVQRNVSGQQIEDVVFPLPPISEQRCIAEVLRAHDALIRAEEAALDKLRQVKRGLMDDLLTGRVRV